MNPKKVPWALLGIFLIFLLGLHSEIRQVEKKNELLSSEIDDLEIIIRTEILGMQNRIHALQRTHKKLAAQRDYLLGLRPVVGPPEPVVAQMPTVSEEGKGHE